jgi:S-adenosylmethionine:tRNA-ribosyltransferase-isomerase (queuine synthetase)
MTIQDHTESCISMMNIKLDQHSIILDKFWMKKHEVSYYDHDDSISFHLDHCNHLEASERSFSNQSTKKKDFFQKRIFSDQSKLIKNKKIKIFLEKINNSSKTILKRTTSIESSKRLNERSERLIELRMNESWRKKLKKMKISSSRILRKESKMNSFYDEISQKFHEKSTDEERLLKFIQ